MIFYIKNQSLRLIMTEQSNRGGKRAGAGRKPNSNSSVTVRLSKKHHRLLQVAGSRLIAQSLDLALKEKISFEIDPKKLTLKERDEFLAGVKSTAIGPEQPWWRPWMYDSKIWVCGATPQEWGTSYGKSMQVQMEDVEIDYAHMAGQAKMKQILVEKLNRFTRQELMEGVAVDAIISVDRFFFYARAAYDKKEFPKDAPDAMIECFISDLAELSSMWMKLVESDDISKAREQYPNLRP